MLVVLAGLPGVGKTTIARELVRTIEGVHLRIDSIEQGLRRHGMHVQGEGYSLAHVIAEDNLVLGRHVVADCVNPWPITRTEWRDVDARAGVPVLDVEVICSDVEEHRRADRHYDADHRRSPRPVKDERVYLGHIRDAINDIKIYASVGEEAFIADRMRQDAIIRKLEIIGEAVKQLSHGTRVRADWPPLV